MWVVPTLGETLAIKDCTTHAGGQSLVVAERAWRFAIATLPHFLHRSVLQAHSDSTNGISAQQGIMLVGPTPVISDPQLLSHLHTWTFASGHTSSFQLPPVEVVKAPACKSSTSHSIPLLPADPLASEQFCLIQTPTFGWLAVLSPNPDGTARFHFTFEPQAIAACLSPLKSRIQLTCPTHLDALEQLLHQFPPCQPDYRLPTEFSQQLLATQALASTELEVNSWRENHPPVSPVVSAQHTREICLPQWDSKANPEPLPQVTKTNINPISEPSESSNDVELLQAIAHEVRTPLATIQTFTRLLLKRSDLPTDVLQRLEAIQRECRQQIDRFGLIFRAMELTQPDAQQMTAPLTAVCLRQVLNDNLASWQQQTERRGLTLTLTVPHTLPAIEISDPVMFEQVLTGLIERLSHSLPPGSEIDLQAALAGEQLKLELRSNPQGGQNPAESNSTPILKAIGQLLMLQPETGGLSLNLAVTKHLCAVLGGKLTVRQHQQQGEILTIFLPLGHLA